MRTSRLAMVAAWALVVVSVPTKAVTLYLAAALGRDAASQGIYLVAVLAFGVVGALIVSRHPRHAIGWLCILLGFAEVGVLGQRYAEYAVATGTPLPGTGMMVWISSWFGPPWDSAPLIFVMFLYPDGRPTSARWATVAWIVFGYVAVAAIALALTPGPVTNASPSQVVVNPLGVSGSVGSVLLQVKPLWLAGFVPAFSLGVGALVVRFRRSRGPARLQLKWFAYAVALEGVAIALLITISFARVGSDPTVSSPTGYLGGLASGLFFTAVPISIGVAILRHRLYDIDVLIKRTLVYGATSPAIAATFWVGILALQPLLRPLTSRSELAVAASTLVSFALFQPIRRYIQDAVDRRFDRSRYDAARTLEVFADQLRDEVELDTLRADLVAAVRATMSPAHTSLWLRKHDGP